MYETIDEIRQVTSLPQDEALCLNEDGKVLMLGQKCRPIDSFVGIVIRYVVSAPNGGLICMLTDRGILITQGISNLSVSLDILIYFFLFTGKGSDGCLGHGDLKHAKKPKIVEALLGEEVINISCSDRHVLALTNSCEIFAWGRNENGCLGLGNSKEELYSLPQKVDITLQNITRCTLKLFMDICQVLIQMSF